MLWKDLRTPAALVDLNRLESNTAKMSDRIRTLGARLRPHVKTHKCAEAARFQVRGHSGGITVSTLAEAHAFAKAGFRDLTYAVPIAPSRLEEACELAASVERLHLLVDHERTFAEMTECAGAKGVELSVFLKVDCGYHRAGVDPENDASVRLALALEASPHIVFSGILTHAGHSYHGRSPAEVAEVAEQERSVMVRFKDKLAQAGAPPPEVSVGSTPTMCRAASLEGVTEARPGNYVFFDRFQTAIGSCEADEVAYSVLVSISSHYQDRGELLVDAGALAFSKDEGPTQVDANCGYGTVYSVEDGTELSGLGLVSLSQEHGKIRVDDPRLFDRYPVGSKLRIVPNHSCLSAALFDRYHVTRRQDVVEEWQPVRGW